ncbi:Rap1-interacting factor 1 N terminal-domain-containing protein [Lipomyces tetrasporus]
MAHLATALPALYTFTHTPTHSPHSSSSPSVDTSSPAPNQENEVPSSTIKPKKRVNFSLSPVTVDVSSPKTPTSTKPIRRKSILKSRPSLTNSSPVTSSPAVSFGLESYPSFTAMLEMMCDALEANDNHTKLDVYLNLNNALRGLKAYPDSEFLLNKIAALVTYIRRDIEFPSDCLDGCESRVMIQALKFFSFLASVDQLVHLIDTQTASWILNLSLSAIENRDLRKNMLLCHLSFLASQRLTRLFNNELSNRIFEVLIRVHNRSRSIEGQCYQNLSTLITMTPSVMLQRASEWVPLALRASFSESSAMQGKAILPLRIASRIFLGVKEFSRVVVDAFNQPSRAVKSPDARVNITSTLFDECYDKIEALLKNKHEDHVLSIWETIVVVLIAWGKRRDERLDKWTYLNKWLDIFRKCINSTDVDVRSRAICAWQKLAYAWLTIPIISSDSDTSKRRAGILMTVFKFLQDNRSETIHALTVTFSKMTCLIMRPGVSTSQISAAEFILRQCEFTWNQLVIPVIRDSCLHNPSTFAFGATLLHALLAASNKTTSNRTEPELCFGTVSLSDIPKLNAKWTRANTELVLETIAKVFDKASTEQDRELAMQVWSAFLKNIQSITQREVRQSPESMDSIASICNYLQAYVKKSDAHPAIFKLLITSTMETFGMMALSEQSVASDDYGNFISTGSPSSRATFDGSGTGSSLNVHSPLVRLWRFYITSVQVRESNMSDYFSSMSAILESVLTALSSRRKSISFLALSLQANALARDSPIISSASTDFISGSDKKAQCWAVLSKYIMDIFADGDDSSQSLLVDDRDLETELKNDLLLSAHRYANDSDIANLAASMFNKADDGLDFIESFMRYLNEEMMARGTTDRYATLTAIIKQLQSLAIKYDRNDSVGRDLLGQTTRLMGDVMRIVFKEIRGLTWGKKVAIDDSFYSSIVSTLRSVNDPVFMSMAESYYNHVCCGIEGHDLTERITASKKPVSSAVRL